MAAETDDDVATNMVTNIDMDDDVAADMATDVDDNVIKSQPVLLMGH